MKNKHMANAQKKPQPKKAPKTSGMKGDPVRTSYEKGAKIGVDNMKKAYERKKNK